MNRTTQESVGSDVDADAGVVGIGLSSMVKTVAFTRASLAAAKLTPREHEVLSLMAQGRSNSAIAGRMLVSEKTVSKHSYNIFTKLGLEPSEDDNRRILAVRAYLDG